MKTMEEYAKQYQHEHRNVGKVSDVTDYSFKFTTKTKEQEKSTIIVLSYFWEPSNKAKEA